MDKPSRESEAGRGGGPGVSGRGEGFGIFEWDLASGRVTWSPEMYRIHGVDPGEFGGTAEDYLPLVHPKDLPLVEEAIGRLRGGAESRPFEYRILRPDGEIRQLLSITEVVRHEDGSPARVVGTVRDVTELREAPVPAAADSTEADVALQRSQERFKAMIENAFDVITIFDSDGTVLYTTPSCRRVLGYEPEELIGRPGYLLVHPDDREAAHRAFQAASGESDSVTQVVHRIRHKDGSYRTVEVVGTNLLAHPAVRGMVSNLRDITERHKLEEALRQAQKMEAVGRLAGGVAHDFNNLLTVILGEVEMALAADGASPELSAGLEHIRTAGERAAGLTRQLLSFSRRELLSFEVLDLNRLVGEAGEMLRRLIEENVEFELDLEPGLWRLLGDRSQLEQLLVNLVVNSRDSMPEGGTLRISTSNVTVVAPDTGHALELPPGDYLRLVVADSGSGMPEEVRDRAFEPFFTTKAENGTGLGLATCYSVAKQHDGHIEAASREGVGTTVTVLLPRAADDEPADGAAVTKAAVGGSETILLVEDEEAVRQVTARMLRHGGYEVLTADAGDEALRHVEERHGDIDLLLTDVVLPGISGRELAEEVAARHPEIRVLYVSGYTDDSILRRGLIERDLTLVRKPFSADELLSRVRSILDGDPVA